MDDSVLTYDIVRVGDKFVVRKLIKGELKWVKVAKFDTYEEAKSFIETEVTGVVGSKLIDVLDKVFGGG